MPRKSPRKYHGIYIRTGPREGKFIIDGGKKIYVPRAFLGEKKQIQHSRRGRSNVSKYKKERVPKNKFCGPAGGSVKGSYPVNTKKRCSAALSYARFSPNPCGIARCVHRKCPTTVGRSSKLMKKCVLRD